MNHDYRDEKDSPHDGDHGTGSDKDHQADGPELDSSSGEGNQGNPPPPRGRKRGKRKSRDGYPCGESYDENTKFVDDYIYFKADGTPYLLVRKTDKKRFPQFHFTPSDEDKDPEHYSKNWSPGAPKGPKILYRLPELSQAAPDALFCLGDGEKDAFMLAILGLIGTCNSEGAAFVAKDGKLKGWASELNATCAGHPIILFEDDDKSGRRLVHTIASQLKGCCPSIKFVRFRDLPDVKDVTDWAERRAKGLFGKAVCWLDENQHATLRDELLARATDFIEDFTNDDFVAAFLQKTKDDPAAPFAPQIVEALAWLKVEDIVAFQRIWAKFKKLGVAVGDLKKCIDDELNQMQSPSKAPPRDDDDDDDDGQPNGFEMTDTELFCFSNKGEPIRVCSAFEVVGESIDPNGKEWGLLLSFKDRGGKARHHHVKFNVLHSDANAICAELGGAGLMIEYDRHKELGKYLCTVRAKGRVVVVNRPGWVEVDGERRFIFPGKIATFVTGAEMLRIVALDVKGNHKKKGTLDEWKNNVALRIKGHYVPMFAVCNAFVGPLLLPTKQESGGVHLQTLSGQGKTTGAAGPAASVWGDGSRIGGYMRSWTITANGLESLLVGCNDTCVVLDEINQADSRVVYSAAYQIANGVGKQRMNRDLTMRDAAMWNVWLVSTGEQTMEQKIAEGREKAMAGQLARIIDVPVDRGKGFGVFDNGGPENDSRKLAEAIEVATSETYGTAGPEFVSQLRKHPNIDVEFKSYKEEFLAKCGIGKEKQPARVAKKFALIAFAGRLAFDFGLLPWDRNAPEEVALWAFNQWMNKRGGVEETEEMQAVAQVRSIVERYGNSRFEKLEGSQTKKIANADGTTTVTVEHEFVRDRLGFRKIVPSDGEAIEWEWYVLPEQWKKELCAGFDPSMVAKTLADRGMLKRPKELHKLINKVWIKGERLCAYVLTQAILEGHDEEEPI